MRKRDPGFYVSILAPPGMSAAPIELLDGPWPTRGAAERRSEEIAAGRPPGSGREPTVIEIAADGMTVLRPEDPEDGSAENA